MTIIEKIIEIAEKELFYKEKRNNNTKYGVWYKMNNQPWCAMFTSWVLAEAGVGKKFIKSASCQAIEAYAIKNNLIVPTPSVQAGDLVLFDFTKAGKAQHIGFATGPLDLPARLVPTIEGNTGPDHIGVNQANGDGVYAKVRNPILIRKVIRPKY
jgi:hypothetical protein